MRIAIAQLQMHPTPEENTRCVLEHLAGARALGADVALFPECAASGYHRGLPPQVSRSGVAEALLRIRERCAALGQAAVVGTPYFPSRDEGRIWNAAVAIDAAGEVTAVCPKVGLTESEHRYFSPGDVRPRFRMGGAPCAVLLCREVRDAARAAPELAGARVVFWPGVIAWESGRPTHPESVVTREIAAECARTLGAYLVQCNWATSLNDPELPGLGGSLVFSPSGALVHRTSPDAPCLEAVEVDPAAGAEQALPC